MKSPTIESGFPSIYKKITTNNPSYTLYPKNTSMIQRRGRQLYKRDYTLITNQDINISNTSTCETKRIIRNNLKYVKKYRQRRVKREIKEDDNSDLSSKEKNDSSSSFSYSRECRKKRFIGLGDEDNIEYPTKRDVGLLSSEDEDSCDNSIIEENFSSEIERILIEIYNKNISFLGGKRKKVKEKKNEMDLKTMKKKVSYYIHFCR